MEEGIVQVLEGIVVVVESTKPKRDFDVCCGGNHDLEEVEGKVANGRQRLHMQVLVKFDETTLTYKEWADAAQMLAKEDNQWKDGDLYCYSIL